ncbi:MAG: hypothetical protein K9M44_00025 [Candidatus Pacebacteria bacterium]|nr:hypothetical protein [Candidatus Paceibacterota bacterium]
MSSSLKPEIDIGIIANSTSPSNRLALKAELGEPQMGFFPPLKFSFGHLKGHIIPLDIQPGDIFSSHKMTLAREACLLATDRLVESGAKVVCFTASTKRLPGKNGVYLLEKPYYKKTIFSIGDSATTLSFLATIKQGLKITFEHEKVVVIGGGFLGLEAVKFITKLRGGRQNLSLLSAHTQNLHANIEILQGVKQLEEGAKILIVCTHKHNLDAQTLQKILAKDAIVIDVAAPPGISWPVFKELKPRPKRWSAGDFYLENIDYSFSPEILSFPNKNFFYGCFTEALCLALASSKSKNGNLKKFNFFSVNDANQALLQNYLRQIQAKVPLVDFFCLDKGMEVIDF